MVIFLHKTLGIWYDCIVYCANSGSNIHSQDYEALDWNSSDAKEY